MVTEANSGTSISTTAPHPPRLLRHRVFSIDVRSLAALRIGLAVVLLVDLLVLRWPWAAALLSDEGVLSREMAQGYLGIGYWSLYGFDSSPLNAQILIGFHAIAAIGLLVGWHTKFMTMACLVLAWSVQVRNPLILSGGDVLLRVLLWWSVFLPLGAVASVDAWRSPFRRPARFVECSPATAGILIQMAVMYLFAGIAKCNADWFSGDAVGMAMQLEMFAKPAAGWLLSAGSLLPLLSWAVLALELVGPFLLFSPWQTNRLRWILMLFFCGMHLSIWLTMSIGIFSATAIVGWVLFLPSDFWNRWCGCPPGFWRNQPVDYPELRRAGYVICSIAIVAILVINVFSRWREPPAWYRETGRLFARVTMLDQAFDLWGRPPRTSPRFLHEAVLEDGSRLDLSSWYFFGEPDVRESIYRRFPSQSWRLLYWTLRKDIRLHPEIRQRLLDFLVKNCEAEMSPVRSASILLIEDEADAHEVVPWASYPERSSPGSRE